MSVYPRKWGYGAGEVSRLQSPDWNAVVDATGTIPGIGAYQAQTAKYTVFKVGALHYCHNGLTGKNESLATSPVAATTIHWARDNLTAGRNWPEKIVIQGDLSITTPLVFNSHTVVENQGILWLANLVNDHLVKLEGDNITLFGGIFDGNSAGQTGGGDIYAIRVHADNAIIRDLTVQNAYIDNLAVIHSDHVMINNIYSTDPIWTNIITDINSKYVGIENIHTFGGKTGVEIRSKYTSVSDVFSVGITDCAFGDIGGYYNSYKNLTAVAPPKGFLVDTGSTIINADNIHLINMTGDNGLIVKGELKLVNGHITGIGHPASVGIYVYAENVHILNTEISGWVQAGILTEAGNGVYTANQIHDNVIGIALTNIAGSNITRLNTFKDNTTTYLDAGAGASDNKVSHNIGYVTENKGVGTILSGNTSLDDIDHGCDYTPDAGDFTIIFIGNTTADFGNWWIDGIDADHFDLNVRTNPGASNLDFRWAVRKA